MKQGDLIALALLANGPRHPYELNKQIDDMQIRQWAKLGASTLYTILARLSKKGCVRQTREQVDSRPPRKVYAITRKGRDALNRLIAEGLTSPAPVYADRLVAAVFTEFGGADIKDHVASAKKQLRAVEKSLTDALKTPALSPQGRAIIGFQMAVAAAEYDAIEALGKARKRQPRSG